VAQGVGDEVREDLADPDRVDLEDREVARDLGAQLDSSRGRRRLERAHDLADQDVGIGRFGVEGERPGLGERQRPQIVDEPAEDARLVEDEPEVGPVGRIDVVEDRLEIALHDGERRPELVADIGQQRPALRLVGLGDERSSCRTRRSIGGRPGDRRSIARGRRPGPCSRRP